MISFDTGRILDEMQKRVREIKRAQTSAQNYYDAPSETQQIMGHSITFTVGACRVSHAGVNRTNHQTGPESWKLDGKRISFTNLLFALSEVKL